MPDLRIPTVVRAYGTILVILGVLAVCAVLVWSCVGLVVAISARQVRTWLLEVLPFAAMAELFPLFVLWTGRDLLRRRRLGVMLLCGLGGAAWLWSSLFFYIGIADMWNSGRPNRLLAGLEQGPTLVLGLPFAAVPLLLLPAIVSALRHWDRFR